MKRNLTCIICPRGCSLEAEQQGSSVTVTGNGCPKGAQYGESECLHPVRTVTATVRVVNRPDTMVPVKTEQPVPKEKMQEVMAALRKLQVSAPIPLGTTICKDLHGTNIITTKEVL